MLIVHVCIIDRYLCSHFFQLVVKYENLLHSFLSEGGSLIRIGMFCFYTVLHLYYLDLISLDLITSKQQRSSISFMLTDANQRMCKRRVGSSCPNVVLISNTPKHLPTLMLVERRVWLSFTFHAMFRAHFTGLFLTFVFTSSHLYLSAAVILISTCTFVCLPSHIQQLIDLEWGLMGQTKWRRGFLLAALAWYMLPGILQSVSESSWRQGAL